MCHAIIPETTRRLWKKNTLENRQARHEIQGNLEAPVSVAHDATLYRYSWPRGSFNERSSRCSESWTIQGLAPHLVADTCVTSAPRGAQRAGPSRASRHALWLVLLDRSNHLLPQPFPAPHPGGRRHGSLARPQHQPGWPYHIEYGLELLDDRIRRPSNHLLHLLCLLIANIAKGVA